MPAVQSVIYPEVSVIRLRTLRDDEEHRRLQDGDVDGDQCVDGQVKGPLRQRFAVEGQDCRRNSKASSDKRHQGEKFTPPEAIVAERSGFRRGSLVLIEEV